MLLAMLTIAESRRVKRHVRFMTGSDLNSSASASRVGVASASSSARNLELKATLADPGAQVLARFLTQQTDILLIQMEAIMEGNPKLQEEIRALTGEVRAMMVDPLLQMQATLVAERLAKLKVDANSRKQATQFLEQAKEVMAQMQTMMTDPRLQGVAKRLAKQMEKGMSFEEVFEAMEAMEAIMAKSRLAEHARRLFKQLEVMRANQNFQSLAAQLTKTLMADTNFQTHARRIAFHMVAIRAHLTSQKTDGGPMLDSFSLAEVNRSSLGVAFAPPSLFTRRPVAVASRPAASQEPQSHIRMSDPLAAVMPRRRRLVAPWRHARVSLRLDSQSDSEESAVLGENTDDIDNDASLSDEFEAGMEFGTEMRSRLFAPRIDDPGLPFADALVCIGGALFVAQWALNPAIPPGIRIPLPVWLTPIALPSGVNWRGVPFIFPALSHGSALAVCWVLGAFAASAYEAEAYSGTWQTALARTWRAGAFAVGVLILSTQLLTSISLSSQGLDPYTVPTAAGVDQLAQADMQILSTTFEVVIDVVVQAVFMTFFRLYRWADAQMPPPGAGGRNSSRRGGSS